MKKFVAVGGGGLRISSTDGMTWSQQQLGKEGEGYRAVAYGNGVFAAVGGFGYGDQLMAVSADGTTWKVTQKPKTTVYRSVFFGAGKFLALAGDAAQVGDAKPVVAISTDGAAWSEAKRITGRWLLRRLAFGNGMFVGVGDRGRRSVSSDGLEWKDAPSVKAIDTLVDVAFGNGLFVGVGLHSLRMTSRDGLNWSEPQRGKEGEHLNAVVYADGRFVAVGQGVTFTSADGEKWVRAANENAPLSCVFGHGVFVGTRWKGRIFTSPDAITWKGVHQCPHHIESVTFGGE